MSSNIMLQRYAEMHIDSFNVVPLICRIAYSIMANFLSLIFCFYKQIFSHENILCVGSPNGFTALDSLELISFGSIIITIYIYKLFIYIYKFI